MANQDQGDRRHDKIQDDSVAPGDPPAGSGGGKTPRKEPHERGIEERPTGTPNSDRHGAETAYQWEGETKPAAPLR